MMFTRKRDFAYGPSSGVHAQVVAADVMVMPRSCSCSM
jgi:hypothetical protein